MRTEEVEEEEEEEEEPKFPIFNKSPRAPPLNHESTEAYLEIPAEMLNDSGDGQDIDFEADFASLDKEVNDLGGIEQLLLDDPQDPREAFVSMESEMKLTEILDYFQPPSTTDVHKDGRLESPLTTQLKRKSKVREQVTGISSADLFAGILQGTPVHESVESNESVEDLIQSLNSNKKTKIDDQTFRNPEFISAHRKRQEKHVTDDILKEISAMDPTFSIENQQAVEIKSAQQPAPSKPVAEAADKNLDGSVLKNIQDKREFLMRFQQEEIKSSPVSKSAQVIRTPEPKRMDILKSKSIEPAVDQINTQGIPLIDIDDLEIIQKIGQGMIGISFICKYKGDIYLLKKNKSQHLNTPIQINEFYRKLARLQSIGHPQFLHIKFAMVDTRNSEYLIITEYFRGESLYEQLHEEENRIRLTVYEKLGLLQQIVTLLSVLHKHKIPFLGLHTKNIFLNDEKKVFVRDFGFDWIKLKNFQQGNITNTFTYPAELLEFSPSANPTIFDDFLFYEKSDVYAFAMLSWEVFSGRIPFHDIPSRSQLFSAIVRDHAFPYQPPDTPVIFWKLMHASWHPTPVYRPSLLFIEKIFEKPFNFIVQQGFFCLFVFFTRTY